MCSVVIFKLSYIKTHNTGTNVDGAVARQFSTDTGASLSLHDLSVRNLSANYDHFIDRESLKCALCLVITTQAMHVCTTGTALSLTGPLLYIHVF